MKKILALLLALLLVSFAFVACTPDTPNPDDSDKTEEDGNKDDGTGCQHTFSEEWSFDKTTHWHKATCEHGEIKDGHMSHKDLDEDGKCDVCAYEVGHEHSFAKEWSSDEENHWKAATCTHKDETKDLELHSDDNDNGECDICKAHVHCANDAGFCKFDGCGKVLVEIDKNNLEAIVTAILAQSKNVNGGHVDFVKTGRSNLDTRFASTSTQTIDFTFGKSHAYYNVVSKTVTYDYDTLERISYSDSLELWHEADGTETFGVTKVDGQLSLVASDPDKLYGYYFYTDNDQASGHGTENFLFNLYVLTKIAEEGTLNVEYDAENQKVSFTFGYLAVSINNVGGNAGYNPDFEGAEVVAPPSGEPETVYNVNYYEFKVDFTYDENYVLTGLDVVCDRYTNDAGVDKAGNPVNEDVDLEYDPVTGTFKFVKYNSRTGKFETAESATPDTYSYTITQTVGDRTAENENPKTKFIPETFDLFVDEARTQKLEGAVNRNNKNVFRIYAESTIDFVFDLISFEILDANGNLIEGVEIVDGTSEVFRATFTYDTEGRHFMLAPKASGTYTLVVYYQGKALHQVEIIVK